MAFGTSQASAEVNQQTGKLYIGCGNFKIVAINPSKEEKQKIYPNRTITEEPSYVSTDQNGVQNMRVEFTLQSLDIPELIVTISFFVRKEASVGRTSGKIEVIDEYGRNAWVTPEQFEKKEVPMYSNGPAKITTNYRKAMSGEVAITNWMKQALAIKNYIDFMSGMPIANPSEAECRFEHVGSWFDNNAQEVRDIWNVNPDAVFTAMVGIRSTDRGMFMSVYPLNNARSWTEKKMQYIFSQIVKEKNNDRLGDTLFLNEFIHEYIKPTDLSTPKAASQPVVENNMDLTTPAVEMPKDDDLPF